VLVTIVAGMLAAGGPPPEGLVARLEAERVKRGLASVSVAVVRGGEIVLTRVLGTPANGTGGGPRSPEMKGSTLAADALRGTPSDAARFLAAHFPEDGALGWRTVEMDGRKVLAQSAERPGARSAVAALPGSKLGVVVVARTGDVPRPANDAWELSTLVLAELTGAARAGDGAKATAEPCDAPGFAALPPSPPPPAAKTDPFGALGDGSCDPPPTTTKKR
jgi:hypothetical protein